MQILPSLERLAGQLAPSVVTVGNFDGVHLAHRAVIARVIERARARNARSVAVTFDPHPSRILRPEHPTRLLTPTPAKLKLLAETGLDAVLVLPFTLELSRWTAREFAAKVLRDALRAVEVHEGENFHFGHGAAEGVVSLEQLGSEFGFAVSVFDAFRVRGTSVSSSRIRELIAAGEVNAARHLLGRWFSISSTPAAGRGYGTRYIVPTINLAEYDELLPAIGVYVSHLRVGSKTFYAVTNVGNRPTFGENSFAVESHLLDFHEMELAETTPLELTFLHRLRPERKWPTPEALRQQIGVDVARSRSYLRRAERSLPAIAAPQLYVAK